ncbi:unnamed protein product [Boreogadus saida]
MSDHNQNNNRDAYISYLAARLLLRKFVCERIAVPWSEIQLPRSPRGRAKSAMAGRLLLRKFVCERISVPWSDPDGPLSQTESQERVSKAKHLQFVSGVKPILYWLANYTWLGHGFNGIRRTRR